MAHVVILGGGYGGNRVVHRLLEQRLPPDTKITLIDRFPFHYLKTEFHAVAAGTKPIADVRIPFPEDERLAFKSGKVVGISLDEKLVHLKNDESMAYDYLVIALGCEDNYRGIDGAKENTISIQSVAKTLHTLSILNWIKRYSHVRIIGAGLTSVELVSELRESRPDVNITVYQRSEEVLGAFPEKIQEYVLDWFERHDIRVSFNARIHKIEPNVLHNGDDELPSEAIVWGAGVQPNKYVQALDVEKAHDGRLIVDDFHQIPGYPGTFVSGDCANLPFAPSAQLAEHQGDQIAEVLGRYLRDESLSRRSLKEIKLRGTLGSLGAKDGFGVAMGMHITGTPARIMKSAVLGMQAHNL